MTMRQSLASLFGLGLILAATPYPLFAQAFVQTTTGTTTGTTTTTAPTTTTTTNNTNTQGGTSVTTQAETPKGVRSSPGSGTTSIPSASNTFGTTYIDYLALGKPSLYQNTGNPIKVPILTTSTFGQPIYGNVATTKVGGGAGAGGQGAQSTAIGFSTVGILRAPVYITALSPEIPLPKHLPPAVLADARAVIEQSSYINNKERIEVTVNDAGVILLRGQVATEKERRIAETTLRITPGVRDVQNMLVVVAAK